MSWHKDANGAPMWAGTDSIVNGAWLERQKTSANKWDTGTIAFGVITAVSFLGMTGGDAVSKFFGGIGFAVFGLITLFYGAMWLGTGNHHREQWLTQEWTLRGDKGALTYKGAASWSVHVDQVASVEASQTINWQRVRQYPGVKDGALIPEFEWQTFLVMADQSRRVILTANAGREACTTLAASIRAYVEAERAAAKSAPVAVSTSPDGEGFDL